MRNSHGAEAPAHDTRCEISVRSLAVELVFCAAALNGCGGVVTDPGRGRGAADIGGTDAGGGSAATGSASAGAGGAASGGHSGTSAAGAPGAVSDGGTAVCPIQVSGTDLTEADCYACIQPGAECRNLFSTSLSLPSLNAKACAGLVVGGPQSSLWCVWYADDASATRPGGMQTCKSNPGRVECGQSF
jgi:hypothetical protein